MYVVKASYLAVLMVNHLVKLDLDMQIETQLGLLEEMIWVLPGGSFDGYNEGKPVGLLFGESLGSDDRTVLRTSDAALDTAKEVMIDG